MYNLLYLSRKTQQTSPKIRKISRINTRFKHNIYTSQRRHSEVLFFGKQRETFSTTSKTTTQNKRKKREIQGATSLFFTHEFQATAATRIYSLLKSNKHLLTILGFHHLDSPQAVRPLYLVVLSKVRKQSNTLTNKQLKHKQPQNPQPKDTVPHQA